MAYIKKKFQVGSWSGDTRDGYQYLPDSPDKKYPLIFFFHGVNGSAYTQGPLVYIKKTWKPDFMIVQIQNGQWPLAADQAKYVIDNDPDIKKYHNGQTLITGLSGGGQRTIEYMNLYNSPQISFVSMSPSDVGISAKGTVKQWNFVGNADKTTLSALRILTDLQKKYGGKLTVYAGGHSGWDKFYNPDYKEDGKTIYDYSFEVAAGGQVEPPVTPEPPIPVPEITEDIAYLDTKHSGKVEIKIKKVNGVWQV